MTQEIKNKISIYLLKEKQEIQDVLKKDKDKDGYKSVELSNSSEEIFYYDENSFYEPSWKRNFFDSRLDSVDLKNRSSKGVYFVKLKINNNERIFAVPFGYGHSMIDKTKCEDNFGLKTVLNLIDNQSIRKISKRTLTSDPKNTVEQLSKIGQISDFSIDIEQDLVEGITGKPKKGNQEKFGENLITGKLALTISAKVNISNIQDFLKDCFEKYSDDAYKKNFAFIDFIKEVKDTKCLNDKLIKEIKKDNLDEKIWLAVPEIINWEDVEGFSFTNKKENLLNDIYYEDFKKHFSNKDNFGLNFLKSKKIIAFNSSNDNEYNSWSIFQCIYCEIDDNDKKFILTNGKWYEIAKSFVDEINNSYNKIIDSSKEINLPNAKEKEKENEYNDRISEENSNYILMDRKNINYGGGSSSVEFCDIYDKKNKEFIHIKNYYGSSALSHLFAQGKVSGRLFLNDVNFRQEVINKEEKFEFIKKEENRKRHKIVFGIISKSEKDLDLPFFSKVNLSSEKKLLNAFGFQDVYLVKIQRNNN